MIPLESQNDLFFFQDKYPSGLLQRDDLLQYHLV